MLRKCFVLLFLFSQEASAQNYLANSLIPPDYDRTLIPTIGPAPLPIEASIRINSFSVNERAQVCFQAFDTFFSFNILFFLFQTITSDLYLCMKWQDYRIVQIDYEQVRLTNFGNLWIPQVNFREALSAAQIVTVNPFQYVQVFPQNQTINYCRRISVEFICVLQLPNFPFDEQYCELQLENCKF